MSEPRDSAILRMPKYSRSGACRRVPVFHLQQIMGILTVIIGVINIQLDPLTHVAIDDASEETP